MGVFLLILGLAAGWLANVALRKGEFRFPQENSFIHVKKDTRAFDIFLLGCMAIAVVSFSIAVYYFL